MVLCLNRREETAECRDVDSEGHRSHEVVNWMVVEVVGPITFPYLQLDLRAMMGSAILDPPPHQSAVHRLDRIE